MHGHESPSPWVRRWAHLLCAQAQVLDVACGQGRHMRYLASLGHQLTGVDQSEQALAHVQGLGNAVLADIENGPWPFTDQGFDGIVVTNYLWRPVFPKLLRSLRAGGVMIYETFAQGNETVGRPARADFLLQHGELLRLCADMHIVAYEEGCLSAPERFVQRIVAILPPHATPAAFPLSA